MEVRPQLLMMRRSLSNPRQCATIIDDISGPIFATFTQW